MRQPRPLTRDEHVETAIATSKSSPHVVTRIAVLASSVLVGCGSEPTTDLAEASIRDSAGVEIVEYSGPLPAHSLIELAPPAYRHGSRPGDHLFQGIHPGALRADGSAVVADGGASEIVAISRDGSTATVLASKGEGPEEVILVRSIHVRAGDTTVVEDDGNAKFLELDDTTFVRSVPIPRQRSELAVHAVAEDGTLLMATDSWRRDDGTDWVPGYMVRFDIESGTLDTVASYDLVPVRHGDEPYNPFGPSGHLTATPEGFVYGRTDRAEFVWRNPDGSVRRVVRWRPESAYPTEADLTAYVAQQRSMLARFNPGMPEDQIDRMLDDMDFPLDQPLPLYARLRGNKDGSLWLTEFDSQSVVGADAQEYIEISPDGRYIRRVVFPEPVQILDVGSGRVLAVVTDEMDIEHVALFEMPSPE